jgi:site-specific DNA recombinase
MTRPAQVAIYARYSSELSRDASIEDQVRLCRQDADRLGCTVTEVFEDRAISGASAIRPGYQALLAAVAEGRIDVVLAEALDRLSRDQEDIAALHKRLRFLGVKLVTVSEGEIGDLHIGLKGAMNALYLKDLADKTRRGLEGRVRAGRSGGGRCYGYDVVPGEERGGRTINEDEAAIVRRIYTEFAAGRSPKAIARRLNDDGIPGPRGILWRDTAIRGHRQRGTGLLNNELYIGHLVWNRLRYVNDPASGRRVSRLNPPEARVVVEVPDLRIVDDALWQAVKARQAEIDAEPGVQAIKASRFWERRRAVHMLTGRAFCGACGGPMAAAGRDYLACSNARKLGTCGERNAIRRPVLEGYVLELVRDRLMEPDAVQAFVSAYHQEINARHDAAAAEQARRQKELAARRIKLEGLYDAVAGGLRTAGLVARLEALEEEVAALEATLAAPSPEMRPVPANINELYHIKVRDLATSVADPLIREEAIVHMRALTDRVEVAGAGGGQSVKVFGALQGMIRPTLIDDAPRPRRAPRNDPRIDQAPHDHHREEPAAPPGEDLPINWHLRIGRPRRWTSGVAFCSGNPAPAFIKPWRATFAGSCSSLDG